MARRRGIYSFTLLQNSGDALFHLLESMDGGEDGVVLAAPDYGGFDPQSLSRYYSSSNWIDG